MKKAALIAALAVLAIVQTALYWNAHLYNRARRLAEDPAGKARLLERAVRAYPWNELVHFELGKAYFELAVNDLGNAAVRDASFDKSFRSFMASLRLDPGAVATHFHFAQSLLYMSYLSLPAPFSYFEEFKKAILLTGHNTQVYFEVGRVLLSRWESLSPEEKTMTLDTLRKTLAARNKEKFQTILEVWYLNARDYSVIEEIIPRDAEFFRMFGRFVGERSLDIKERLKAMAAAEALVFETAKAGFELGQRSHDYYQPEDALRHLTSCLNSLNSIRFYQALTEGNPVDPEEYNRIRRDTYLLLSRIQVDRDRSLADPDAYIQTYLSLEDQVTAVAEFEKFLKERGLLGNGGDFGSSRRDFGTVAFQMSLDFKQNRYREITRVAAMLEGNLLIVPEAGRESYVRILQIIGDSYLKLDYVYEAEKYYLRALGIAPDSLETLLKLEKCYERLNNTGKAGTVRATAASLLTPREFIPGGGILRKGETRTVRIVSDGAAAVIRIAVEPQTEGIRPLVSVFFGGRIVWEGYVDGGELSFSITPAVGPNTVFIAPVNGPIALSKIEIAPETES